MMVDLVSCVMTGEGPQMVLITQTLLIEGRCDYSLEKSLHKGNIIFQTRFIRCVVGFFARLLHACPMYSL